MSPAVTPQQSSPSSAERTLARLATACFLRGIALAQWMAMDAGDKVRLAREIGISVPELIEATQFLGDLLTAQSVAVLQPYAHRERGGQR